MEAEFWGTRGSVPAPLGAKQVRAKIRAALELAIAEGLDSKADIDDFITNRLPFDVAGTFGGNTSCVEVRDGSRRVILDMGSGLRGLGARLLAEGAGSMPNRLDIVMSHLHWDHIQGLPFFGPAYREGIEIHIWSCHPATESVVRAQHSPPTFPVEYDLLPADIRFHQIAPETIVEIGGFEIIARKQIHHGDSYGYRITHGGKSIVYATDIEHKADRPEEIDACVAFFREADLVVFDAMFAWGETQSIRQDWGHSSNVVGVDLCRMAEARRLCLFHHDPANSDADLVASLAQTRRYLALAEDAPSLEIISAYDGLIIEV